MQNNIEVNLSQKTRKPQKNILKRDKNSAASVLSAGNKQDAFTLMKTRTVAFFTSNFVLLTSYFLHPSFKITFTAPRFVCIFFAKQHLPVFSCFAV